MHKKLLLLLLPALFSFSLTAQDTSTQVFSVKKAKQQPVPLTWPGIDSCRTGQLYTINTTRLVWDSISVYKMQYKIITDLNKDREYVLWKNEEGVAYLVIWTRMKDGTYKQTYVKPVYFYNPARPVAKNANRKGG